MTVHMQDPPGTHGSPHEAPCRSPLSEDLLALSLGSLVVLCLLPQFTFGAQNSSWLPLLLTHGCLTLSFVCLF